MAFLVSPGVQVRETDATNFVPALSTSVGAYAGFFNWGPFGQPVTINSEKALGSVFGVPNTIGDPTDRSFFTAASFLKYGNNLKVSRAVPSDANNASTEDGSPTLKQLADQSDVDLYGSYDEIYGRYPGSIANGLQVYMIDYDQYNDSPFPLPASIDASLPYEPSTTTWAKNVVDPEDNISEFDVSLIKDERHVVVVDGEGNFSGVAGTILEIFPGVSGASNAKNQYGESNYYINVVNNGSKYIFFAGESSTYEVVSTTTSVTPVSTLVQTLKNGADGDRNQPQPIVQALELFEDVEFIDVNLVFAQNLYADPDDAYNTTDQKVIDLKLVQIVEGRKDCITFLSAPLGVSDQTRSDDQLDTVREKFDRVESSSYVVFDSSPAYVYNQYRDSYLWIPLCGHMAGLCALTDETTDPWFSPAGYDRGRMRGIVKLAFNPNQSQRDDLYTNRVNPVVSFPGRGVVLFGDKTALAKPSAFDRINVRRMFITIEKAVATAAKFQLFEINDEFTRSAFTNAIVPFLRDIQGRRGLENFSVQCDEINNDAEVVNSNRMVAEIRIQPTHSINFIYLNFIATRSGVNVTETLGIAPVG